MAIGDVKLAFGTSTEFTVVGLVDLDSSATWVVGWCSDEVDNSSNLYEDYLVSGEITILHDGSPTVGEIRVYVISELSDTTWPAVITHNDTANTFALSNQRDSVCKLAAVITNTATVHLIYPFGQFSVAALFGGICPRKFVVFITHNTTTTLDHDGQVVTYHGVYHTVAAS